jgi:branched-chain amino acid transport system ATP-binding protein
MLLEVRNLWAHYGSAEALKGVSMNIETGEIVTLIGSNGSGKTTFLRTLTKLKSLTSGEMIFQGEVINRLSSEKIIQKGIGHVLEGRRLFPYMTVLENLKLGAYLRRDAKKIAGDIEDLFEHFPILKARCSQKAGTLSGGEQQMVAIGRALMGKPSLLLMDEPSMGLAPLMVKEIGGIIRAINQNGVSIILVEQNARLALGLAHRGYVLEVGKVVLEGRANELAQDSRVRTAYLGI